MYSLDLCPSYVEQRSATKKEEVDFMKSPARAIQVIEYLDACMEAGLVEFESLERD